MLLGSSAGELMAGKDCNSDKAEDGTAVAVAVTNGNIMWIGSSGGGVWEVSAVPGCSTTGANADCNKALARSDEHG